MVVVVGGKGALGLRNRVSSSSFGEGGGLDFDFLSFLSTTLSVNNDAEYVP